MSTIFVNKLTKNQTNQILQNVLGKHFNVDTYPEPNSAVENNKSFRVSHLSVTPSFSDVWAVLDGNKLIVQAFDHSCFLKVKVELTDHSISIPSYSPNSYANSSEAQANYVKELARLFGKEYYFHFYNNLQTRKENMYEIEEKIFASKLTSQERNFLNSFQLGETPSNPDNLFFLKQITSTKRQQDAFAKDMSKLLTNNEVKFAFKGIKEGKIHLFGWHYCDFGVSIDLTDFTICGTNGYANKTDLSKFYNYMFSKIGSDYKTAMQQQLSVTQIKNKEKMV